LRRRNCLVRRVTAVWLALIRPVRRVTPVSFDLNATPVLMAWLGRNIPP
jgi:hypothetical protein